MKKHLMLPIAMIACALPGAALAQDSAAPASEQSQAVDPARLAAAQSVVAKLLPPGSYAEMMKQAMGSSTEMALDSMAKLPMRDLVGVAGVTEEKLATMGDGSLAEIMAIYDPAFKERMSRMMNVMTQDMAELFAQFEPDMRAGLERAYAKRFSVEQLNEMNRFFDSSTGRAYAAQSLLIWTDPDVMAGMQKAMPEVMKAMPAIMTRVTEATADLPPPRTFKDLTKEERKRLAELLGISEAELKRRN